MYLITFSDFRQGQPSRPELSVCGRIARSAKGHHLKVLHQTPIGVPKTIVQVSIIKGGVVKILALAVLQNGQVSTAVSALGVAKTNQPEKTPCVFQLAPKMHLLLIAHLI